MLRQPSEESIYFTWSKIMLEQDKVMHNGTEQGDSVTKGASQASGPQCVSHCSRLCSNHW